MPGTKRKAPRSSSKQSSSKFVKLSLTCNRKTKPEDRFTEPSTSLALRRERTLVVTEKDPLLSTDASAQLPLTRKSPKAFKKNGTSQTKAGPLETRRKNTTDNSYQIPNIPSGLTQLALPSGDSNLSLQMSATGLLGTIGDAEMTSALASLKDIDTTHFEQIPNSSAGLAKPELSWDSEQTPYIPSGLTNLTLHTRESKQTPKIPSGLTKLALPSSGSNLSLHLPGTDLLINVDDAEMTSALHSLKSVTSHAKDGVTEIEADNNRTYANEEPGLKKDINNTASPAVPSGDPFEIVISVSGDLEETRDNVKEYAKALKQYIPDVRLAVVTSAKNLVRWIDFGGSIDEICGFVDEVEMTADTAEIYQLKQKTIDETLSWTPGSRRLISHLGDAIHNRNLAEFAFMTASSYGYVASDDDVLNKECDSPSSTPRPADKITKRQHITKAVLLKHDNKVVKHVVARRNLNKATTNRPATRMAKVARNKRTITPAKAPKVPSKYSHMTQTQKTIKKDTKKKLLREQLADTVFQAGPIKKLLKWTDWVPAICNTLPHNYSRSEYKRPRNSQSFHRKDLGYEVNVETLFEFGVQLERRRKVFATFYCNHYHSPANTGRLTDYLLRHKKVRLEVERLLKEKCQIYVRRAAGRGKDKATKQFNLNEAIKYLKTLDYAWLKHGKEGHRKVVKNKILISDRTL